MGVHLNYKHININCFMLLHYECDSRRLHQLVAPAFAGAHSLEHINEFAQTSTSYGEKGVVHFVEIIDEKRSCKTTKILIPGAISFVSGFRQHKASE